MTAWHTLLAIDFDKHACAAYRANFPDTEVRCASVADVLDSLPAADVVVGGPPCQPFSDAGENRGETDERDCIPDFIEAVRRVRPRHFLMENVRGLLKQKHARYFHFALDALAACGYIVQWRLLDAVNYGVPQFRERVWIWGVRRDLHGDGMHHAWPLPTHAWPPPDACMFGAALLPGITVGEAIGGLAQEIVMKSWPQGYWGKFSDKHPCAKLNKPAPTLPCDWIGTQSIGLVEIRGTGMMRNFTPVEGLRIQSAPANFMFPPGTPISLKTRIIGNGQASLMVYRLWQAMSAVDPESCTVVSLFSGGGVGDSGLRGRYWSLSGAALEVA